MTNEEGLGRVARAFLHGEGRGGSDGVLAEMKVARDWSDPHWSGLLTPQTLTGMVTGALTPRGPRILAVSAASR